jgi:hypothetical protein
MENAPPAETAIAFVTLLCFSNSVKFEKTGNSLFVVVPSPNSPNSFEPKAIISSLQKKI